MSDYEAIRQRHALRLFEVMPDALERMTWPRERLAAHRDDRLRALLAHAQAHSPWHARRLAGVDVEHVRADDVSALPVMTKNDLMQSFDEIITDRRLTRDLVETHLDALTTDAYLCDEYHVCASGGSSGQRGVFVYDFDTWAVTFASNLRFSFSMQQKLLGNDPLIRVIVAADKASHMTSAFAQTFASPLVPITRVPATWPIARIVSDLNEIQPGMLVAYSSVMRELAREAAAGRLHIAPRMMGVTSEPLLPEIRAAVADVWSVPLFNSFGSTEGLMGGSCSAQRGLHLSDDLFIIEPVDAAGRPVPAGTRAAKVYLTSLVNLTQPLIRYELTDEVTVLDEPCPCGVTLLHIDDIQGRLDDAFTYANGPTVHPFTFRSILGRDRNIIEYQVRQTAAGADIAIRTAGAVETERIAKSLCSALRDLGVAQPAVTVTIVDTLERQSTGKLRRFVPLKGCAGG